ncbi:TnpV protein [Arthrobacter sp. 4R501]|uniref:TnpV protein n=1 Tax=Arthrobacter sp. 4R501 TaxID=2058886 RepID=UPI002158A13C|nr:TnpV protein [Arthrobacter sp. 4R501]
MNEHGRHAMETMKNHDPESFAQIADPETHFSTLGEEIQQAIWDLSEQLTPTRGSEPPLEYIGLANMAKLRAREMVYQQMIYDSLPAEPEEMEPASRQQDEEN